MPLEPQLKPLAGASRLALGFFNSLINRIESIKPVKGTGVLVAQQANGSGFKISLDDSKIVTINVCSNGTPATIKVYTA